MDEVRLIDADELLKEAEKDGAYGYVSAEQIAAFPTVDAVEVVRCGECEYNYANQIPSEDVCYYCVELPVDADFFCARGKKMDEVEDE